VIESKCTKSEEDSSCAEVMRAQKRKQEAKKRSRSASGFLGVKLMGNELLFHHEPEKSIAELQKSKNQSILSKKERSSLGFCWKQPMSYSTTSLSSIEKSQEDRRVVAHRDWRRKTS
jgi:hypothetical protein